MTELAPFDASVRLAGRLPEEPAGLDHDHDLAALPRGSMLFEYRMGAVLGQGGFGITYQAEDTLLDEVVAVKEYFPNRMAVRTNDRSARARSRQDAAAFQDGVEAFLTEARIIARFRHPNIMRVRRYFEAHGTGYMVLDFVHGRSLESALGAGALPEPMIRTILAGLLDGLGTVHDSAVLHRDLKPRNVILRNDDVPVLIDFGAARDFGSRHSHTVTQIVSPGYSSPEQYGVGEQQGPWSDFYSVGAILYRAVTGTVPVDALRRLRQDPLVPAVEAAAGRYDAKLLRLVDAMMAMEPAQRPPSAAAIAAELATPSLTSTALVTPLTGRAVIAEETPTSRSATASPRRWALRASVAIATLAVALVADTAWRWHPSDETKGMPASVAPDPTVVASAAPRPFADQAPAPVLEGPATAPSAGPAAPPAPTIEQASSPAALPAAPVMPPQSSPPSEIPEPAPAALFMPPLDPGTAGPISPHWRACVAAGFCGTSPSSVGPDGQPTMLDDLSWPDLQDFQAWTSLLTFGVKALPPSASTPFDDLNNLPISASMEGSSGGGRDVSLQASRVAWLPVPAGLFNETADDDDDSADDATAAPSATDSSGLDHHSTRKVPHAAVPHRAAHLAGNEALSHRYARHNPCQPVRVGGWRYTGMLVHRTQPTLASIFGFAPASTWQPGCVYGRPSWSGR